MTDVPPLPTPSYGITEIYTPADSIKRPNTEPSINAPNPKRQRTNGGKVIRRRTNKRRRINKRRRTNKNKKSRRQ